MPKFEVGDVVRWNTVKYPKHVRSWQQSYGRDPLVVTGLYVDKLDQSIHPILAEASTGKPVNRGGAINNQAFVKDEFLTAVKRAKRSQEKSAKTG